MLFLYYVGVFFNSFLPSGFGGDAIKMVELARYSRHAPESVSTVLVDRLAGIIVLFAMAVVAWPWAHDTLPARQSYLLVGTSIAGLACAWLLFQKRVAERVLRVLPRKLAAKVSALYDAVHACGGRALWRAIGASAVFNLALFALNYVLALGVGVRVPIAYIIVFMPVLSLSMLLPSLGALGTREGAYVLLFGSAGLSESLALAMSLSFYTINVLTGVIGGCLYALDAAVRAAGTRQR